ncbi:MAG TPA: pyruvate dehydrogenase complex dihydrolipoamide acetyltransferase [Candidatus Sulfotelmatobacter sp.]|jgi:pyruvate dehydrogenase E2 component (dihydrolipoamide acetyltransferase)|nr:pyruvate dehydrogenase complex dihydrolipoamide acetyltransferase [Candidatus Sulfotelmatobacter sp.]
MPINILMPALSPTMTEGTLARWLKNEGDAVKSGDVIAEIETDKATMEFEAIDEGTLAKILVPAGTSGVAVNTLIGVILEEGEDASAISAAAPAAKPAAAPAAAPAPAVSTPVAAVPITVQGDRVFATPLARRIAKDAGLDLKAVAGSGPHGRIVKHDVEEALASGPAKSAAVPAAVPAAAAAPAPAFGPAYTEVPLTSMRKVIAQRLTEAKQTVPHFYLTVDCQLDKLLALRADLNGRSDDYKLSVNDFIIRAVALALKKVPAANASFTDTAIRLYTDVDVSVAVATPAGLITPIVKHADQKGLAAISGEMKSLAAKAKDGKLKPEEFQGGTFTISNLGMFGVKEFAAIINPPQGCILAVGAGEQRPVVKDGALGIATVMSCTLSVDHRVVDGAVGAEFLAAFKKLVEEPLTMLL